MNLTLGQAIIALSNPQYQSIDGLFTLVSQVSLQAPDTVNGAQTFLYSGMVGDIPAWQIAEKIGSSSGGQIITIVKHRQQNF